MKTKILHKLIALILIVGLNGMAISRIGYTAAYYNDVESSTGNTFTSASLDFSLDSDADFAPDVDPDTDAIRTVTLSNDGSLGFQYTASTTNVIGVLCPSLNLLAKLDGAEEYNGPLSGFDIGPFVFDDPEDWDFTTSLNSDDPDLQNTDCNFDFQFDGWQKNLAQGTGGFTDTETISNTVTAGVWVAPIEPGDDNISPIADAYIDQDNPDGTSGNDHDLKVKSQSGGKNKRSFIRLDFHFPSGTSIQSAVLKLFMDSAPSISRTYALARSLSSWIEDDISWNNRPATLSPPTGSAITGTTNNVWLSWNVTDDVSDFVAGTSNYGWGLFDTEENSATSQEGKLVSRNDNDHQDKRPVLEVAFSAPPAPTTHLVINEVYYDLGDGKGNDPNNEWIEIYNPTDLAVDISGWKICEASGSSGCDVIPATASIPAKGFAVASGKSSTWETYWVLPPSVITIDLPSDRIGSNGLADAGDHVILKDTSDIEIDAMSYGSNISILTLPKSGEGNSLARIIKGYDADSADDWIINATPNPGTNPSDSGVEIMRFTSEGVEVADYAAGLNSLAVENPEGPADESISPTEDLIADFFAPLGLLVETATSTEVVIEETATSTTPSSETSAGQVEVVIPTLTEGEVGTPTESVGVEEEVVTEEEIVSEEEMVSEEEAVSETISEEPALPPEPELVVVEEISVEPISSE